MYQKHSTICIYQWMCVTGIQDFVLSGRMGEAISLTQQLYPGLLEHNPNLLFMLKCRQFVEMVKGDDSEVRVLSPTPRTSPRSYGSSRGSSRSSPNLSPAHITSTTISNIPSSNFLHHHPHHVQQQQQQALTSSRHGSSGSSPVHTPGKHSRSSTPSSPSPPSYQHRSVDIVHRMSPEEMKNAANLSPERFIVNGSGPVILENDEMDTDDGCVTVEEKFVANGNICSTVLSMNGSSFELTDLSHGKAEDMGMWRLATASRVPLCRLCCCCYGGGSQPWSVLLCQCRRCGLLCSVSAVISVTVGCVGECCDQSLWAVLLGAVISVTVVCVGESCEQCHCGL